MEQDQHPYCEHCGAPLKFAVPYQWTGHGFQPVYHCPINWRHSFYPREFAAGPSLARAA